MKNTIDAAPAIEATWAAVHGEGMHLELCCTISGTKHYFASFSADPADESLHFELTVSGHRVRIPVGTLESLIASAKADVHSESWYDRHNAAGDGT